MYTLDTSGMLIIFPGGHERAPQTHISCWVSNRSALFCTTHISPSWFLRVLTYENFSEMSIIWAFKRHMMQCTCLDCQYLHPPPSGNLRWCTPSLGTVHCEVHDAYVSKTGLGSWANRNLLRNPLWEVLSLWKGHSGSTTTLARVREMMMELVGWKLCPMHIPRKSCSILRWSCPHCTGHWSSMCLGWEAASWIQRGPVQLLEE